MHALAHDVATEDRLDQAVHRYLDLVYAAALRQMHGDANAAADVTQAVMIVLIKKCRAGKLPEERWMAGWILNVTRNVVLQFRRAAARRTKHEKQVMRSDVDTDVSSSTAGEAELLAALDRAIAALGAVDREAVARRYLQDQSLAEIGAALGMSENTAGRRVARAVEKLRRILDPGGIKVSSAALVALLGVQAAVRAPAACASLATASSLSSEIANQTLLRMTMAKLATIAAIGIGTLFVLLGVVVAVIPPKEKEATTNPSAASSNSPQPGPITLDSPAVLSGPSDSILQQVLAGLAENQKKLRSIHVVSSTMGAMYDPQQKRWLEPSRAEGEAWAEAALPRRERAVVTHAQTRVMSGNGFGNLQDESFVEAWDGKTLFRQFGPPDSDPAGETFVTRYLKGDTLLGADYSMQLSWDIETAQDDRGPRTTIDRNPLAAATLSQMKLSARRVKWPSGTEAMELAVEIPDDSIGRRETFWFDPNRGYALLARQDVLSSKGVELHRITRRIDQLAEPLPGVFYPAKAEMYWEQRGIPVIWGTFEAMKITANETQPDAFFQLDFPADLVIRDFDKNGRGTKRPPS